MSYTSKQAAQELQRVESGANKVVSPKFSDQRASTGVQLKQQQMMNASDANPLQRAQDEELLQGKFETVQRAEEEDLLQGKFETAQLAEEEELLQGKFATAQLAEDEELLQGKFATAQLAEEEELLQGKFATAQLMEEEEPLQGKFESAQLAGEEELLQGKFSNAATTQLEPKPNNTGLPDNLKSGVENLSGYSLDDVKVHYNSSKPSELQAHAYAQGTDIHVAPGQEQHLPHEAWHVVQQKQGRVQPTMQMKAGVPVNDDVGLETEADVMGAKALQRAIDSKNQSLTSSDHIASGIAQMRGRDHADRVYKVTVSAQWLIDGVLHIEPAKSYSYPYTSDDDPTAPLEREAKRAYRADNPHVPHGGPGMRMNVNGRALQG